MVALCIVLGILLLLFLLSLCNIRLYLSFKEEFSLTAAFLFIKLPLLPGKEMTPEEQAAKEEAKKKKEEEKEKSGDKDKTGAAEKLKQIIKRRGFWGFVQSLFELIGIVLGAAGGIVKKIRLKYFDLYLCVSGKEDAAEGAILYGKLAPAVYTACAALFGMTGCEKKGLTVDLSYDIEENIVDFSALITIRLIFILKEAIALIIKALPVILKLARPNKKTERKVSASE